MVEPAWKGFVENSQKTPAKFLPPKIASSAKVSFAFFLGPSPKNRIDPVEVVFPVNFLIKAIIIHSAFKPEKDTLKFMNYSKTLLK